jgi:hypothetical protein
MNKDAEASLRAAAAALVRLRYLDRMLERLASDL